MYDPISGGIFSQGRPLPDLVLFNTIDRLKQDAQASLSQDSMRRLEIDMISRDIST
jgi:hypothetical protein